MKIRLELTKSPKKARVYMDNTDITQFVSYIEIRAGVGRATHVRLDLTPLVLEAGLHGFERGEIFEVYDISPFPAADEIHKPRGEE